MTCASVGVIVLAINEWTGEIVAEEVTETFVHADDLFYLQIAGELLETTATHPFLTEGGLWVLAADLQPGMAVLSATGTSGAVEALIPTDRVQPMHNLEVDAVHTYFVGVGQWVVHNAFCLSVEQREFLEGIGMDDENIDFFAQGDIAIFNTPGSAGNQALIGVAQYNDEASSLTMGVFSVNDSNITGAGMLDLRRFARNTTRASELFEPTNLELTAVAVNNDEIRQGLINRGFTQGIVIVPERFAGGGPVEVFRRQIPVGSTPMEIIRLLNG
ncbi:hypothetical protein HC928_20480 [bacterium]|nr:hypothetical protein [bacterium]